MSVVIDGSAGVTTTTGAVYNSIQSKTAVSASGTSIDFTSIPSWVKRITVMFSDVSLNSTGSFLVQVGTGGTPASSGYVSTSGYTTTPNGAGSSGGIYSSAGFCVQSASPSYVFSGSMIITNLSGNIWVEQGNFANTASAQLAVTTAGNVTLGSTLNIVRITTTTGTDTFDAGSINILYE